jgi:hypothetical protein
MGTSCATLHRREVRVHTDVQLPTTFGTIVRPFRCRAMCVDGHRTAHIVATPAGHRVVAFLLCRLVLVHEACTRTKDCNLCFINKYVYVCAHLYGVTGSTSSLSVRGGRACANVLVNATTNFGCSVRNVLTSASMNATCLC